MAEEARTLDEWANERLTQQELALATELGVEPGQYLLAKARMEGRMAQNHGLTPQELEAARKMGKTPEQYAASKRRMQQEREANRQLMRDKIKAWGGIWAETVERLEAEEAASDGT